MLSANDLEGIVKMQVYDLFRSDNVGKVLWFDLKHKEHRDAGKLALRFNLIEKKA